MKKHHITGSIIIILSLIISGIAAFDFMEMRMPMKLYPSAGLTGSGTLGDYFEDIKGTSGDTPIYYFDSGKPGATVLILGGTHPNEPSSFVAATLILENLIVKQGRIIIIPQACRSGFTCTDPFEAYPQCYYIKTKSGKRRFPMGSRVSNPLDQWPDPLVYNHYPSGQQLSGFETRNLNRSYPGRPDGTFSEKVGYAIMEVIRKERADVAFDFHEAAPEIPIINAIVYHEKGEDIALTAVLNLEMEGMRYSPEVSPENFRGLSHREWGDRTDVIPFLMETSNPIQGRLRGKTNEALIVEGVSERYKEALESGALRIEYNPDGEPIEHRVGRHIQGFLSLLEAYNMYYEDKQIIFYNLPDYTEIMEKGLGHFLN